VFTLQPSALPAALWSPVEGIFFLAVLFLLGFGLWRWRRPKLASKAEPPMEAAAEAPASEEGFGSPSPASQGAASPGAATPEDWLTLESLNRVARQPFGPTNAEETKAYRLARLLVSELVELQEEDVEEGRRHRDLARRLALDLQKSREAYLELSHCPDKDFLIQELLHGLAQGKPESFGL